MLRFHFRALIARALPACVCFAGVAAAETPGPPAEKVRVTYDARPGCPSSEAFFAQVRERVGTDWEAPPNELARTIEVRVTGGADESVARIDFVDENHQPIARVVTAKTCDEVVAGIALVTALAIESRIAEAVGKSEPPLAAPQTNAPTEERKEPPAAPVATPTVRAPPPRSEPPGQSPHVDIGAGALVSAGALPRATVGFRGFAGIGFPSGMDLRVGVDSSSAGSVDTTSKAVGPSGSAGHYLSSFNLLSGRASVCPFAFGAGFRLLPCGGLEVGVLHAEGLGSTPGSSFTVTSSASPPVVWLAPFLGARADATWDVLFVEFELSFGFPVLPTKRDFVFETIVGDGTPPRKVTDTVYSIWPVVPAGSLAVGLRI